MSTERLLAVDKPLNEMGAGEAYDHFTALTQKELYAAIRTLEALDWDWGTMHAYGMAVSRLWDEAERSRQR